MAGKQGEAHLLASFKHIKVQLRPPEKWSVEWYNLPGAFNDSVTALVVTVTMHHHHNFEAKIYRNPVNQHAAERSFRL
jgi:hypothetical protein